MWVKSTEQEQAAAQLKAKRKLRSPAIIVGVTMCLCLTFFHGKYWWRHGHASRYVSPSELPYRLPFALVGGVIAGVLLYWSTPAKRKTAICPQCEKTKWMDAETECSCGGHFEDLETMKWVDNT